MRGEWGRRRRAACGPKRDREGIRRTAGQGGRRRARGVSEGDIPGTRRRRARVEKRVRAAHYARDTSRSSDASGAQGGGRGAARSRQDEARRETHRGRGETGGERKIIERRGRKSVCARRRGAGSEGEEPLEKPGRMLCRRHRPPRSSARAAVDVFCEGKPPPSCESASGDRCTLGTLKRSACEEKERERKRKRERERAERAREREERGRNEVGNARRVREDGGRFGPGRDAQGW